MKPRRGPSISYKITYFTSCTNILPLKHLFYLFSFPVDLISEEDFKEVAVLAGPKTGVEQLWEFCLSDLSPRLNIDQGAVEPCHRWEHEHEY